MPLDSTARRRWLGVLVLVGALGMLIAGQTVLKARLGGTGFLAYWIVCLVLTLTAMVVACIDAAALQRRTRQEHRDLLQKALNDIEAEARARRSQPQSDKRA